MTPGCVTAWSDKHPAYLALSGPQGNGVTDYFTPEINSQAIGYPAGQDWTSDNNATMQYDSYKVQAVLNWIDGIDHSGKRHMGVPAIFGMNFQTVSTAQKLPASDGMIGGYKPGGKVPGPLLVRALNYINTEVGLMVAEIQKDGLASSTAIIISAKHGQSPTNPNTLKPGTGLADHQRDQRGVGGHATPATPASSCSPPTTTGCCCG